MKKLFLFFLLFFLHLPAIHASGSDSDRARLEKALEKAEKTYDTLRDYKAIFQKQERSGKELGPEESIFLKFEKPFKIFMAWMNTHKKGLQVFYERGKHDGKLAIHKPGLLLGLAPLIFLDPDSPWVREGSESYDIEDAGIGSFLHDFSKAVSKAKNENKLQVLALEDPQGGETLDVTFAGSKEGEEGFFAYRVIVHFDKTTALSDRMQLFDWQNRPMGIYAYENLQLNVGKEDEEFKKIAMRKIYQLYWPAAKSTRMSNNFSGKSPRATPTAG